MVETSLISSLNLKLEKHYLLCGRFSYFGKIVNIDNFITISNIAFVCNLGQFLNIFEEFALPEFFKYNFLVPPFLPYFILDLSDYETIIQNYEIKDFKHLADPYYFLSKTIVYDKLPKDIQMHINIRFLSKAILWPDVLNK